MDARQILAKNLREFRIAAGLSQDDVARRMDVAQTYVSGLERGVRNPTLTMVDSAAKALNVRIDELLRERS
jgi:transcriptional regulator with XRE-family HTH domain